MAEPEDSQSPDSGLMGSLGDDGQEILEWPSGSGNKWTRSQIGQEWREL